MLNNRQPLLNDLIQPIATARMLRHGFCATLYFVPSLKFFYIAAAPLCLAREIARQGTAGRHKPKEDAPMTRQQFNAPEILQQIRQRQAIKRRRQFRSSRLTRVRAELVALRQAGGSYRELASWLRQTHRIKITHTSVMRYLTQLPECQEVKDAELPIS